MSNYDERVNNEADEHSQMMSKGREGWDEGLNQTIDKATEDDDAKRKRFHAIAKQVFDEEITPIERFGR